MFLHEKLIEQKRNLRRFAKKFFPQKVLATRRQCMVFVCDEREFEARSHTHIDILAEAVLRRCSTCNGERNLTFERERNLSSKIGKLGIIVHSVNPLGSRE